MKRPSAPRTISMPPTVTKFPSGGLIPTAARRNCGHLEHQVARDDAVFHDGAFAIDVADEGIERAQTLNQARLELGPGLGVDHAGNRIEGEDALDAALFAIDIEGDAHAAEHDFGARAEFEELGRLHREEARVMLVQAERGDFASSTISSKNPSRRGYADQTGTEVPISATLALPIFVPTPSHRDAREFTGRARETRN